jgi:putative toxin-antitoxin system antitoxin component (TIGR02293 family)
MEWQETLKALGGRKVLGKDVVSAAAFVQTIERGLPRNAVTQLKRFSHLSDSDLTAVIPRRTLTSIKRARQLTPEQSDRVASTAGIAALAQRVFGDVEAARVAADAEPGARRTRPTPSAANRKRSAVGRGGTPAHRVRRL